MKNAVRALAALLAMAPPLASAQPRSQPPPPAGFQTPSGNVQCLLREGRLRCEVLEHAYDAPLPRPRDCRGDWGGSLSLGREGPARLLCGPSRGVRNDEAFVLGYGARWARGGVTCDSEEAGLRCRNAAGRGFQVSRSRLEIF